MSKCRQRRSKVPNGDLRLREERHRGWVGHGWAVKAKRLRMVAAQRNQLQIDSH